MKIYYLKLTPRRLNDFIRFSAMFHINIFCTWSEESFFDKFYHVTITDQPDQKITTEEKARLISENFKNEIYNTQNLTA